jgi:hypothetical protein
VSSISPIILITWFSIKRGLTKAQIWRCSETSGSRFISSWSLFVNIFTQLNFQRHSSVCLVFVIYLKLGTFLGYTRIFICTAIRCGHVVNNPQNIDGANLISVKINYPHRFSLKSCNCSANSVFFFLRCF